MSNWQCSIVFFAPALSSTVSTIIFSNIVDTKDKTESSLISIILFSLSNNSSEELLELLTTISLFVISSYAFFSPSILLLYLFHPL